MRRRLGWGILILLATAASSTEVLEVLETSLALETRLLESELARYSQIRGREMRAVRELQRLSRGADQELSNQDRSVERLRELETQLGVARERAYSATSEAAELRRHLYTRMERLAELGEEIEQERKKTLAEFSHISGFWRIEILPQEDFGLLLLEVEGTLVTGTYRLSDGTRGSIRGTVADNRLDLERVDAQGGSDSILEGKFDPETGELYGSWHRKELAGGAPASGDWSARKLPPAEQGDVRKQP
jgi:hypothetical protein